MASKLPPDKVNHLSEYVVHDLKPENRVKIDQEEPKLEFLGGDQKRVVKSKEKQNVFCKNDENSSQRLQIKGNGNFTGGTPKRNSDQLGQAYGAIPKYFKQFPAIAI